jgi:hypothetical protein
VGSGGIASHILELGTRWRWVVSFIPRPLYPRERAPGNHWIGGWVGPRAVLNTAMVKRTIPSQESTPIVHTVAQRYTDWAIPALYSKVSNTWFQNPILSRPHSCTHLRSSYDHDNEPSNSMNNWATVSFSRKTLPDGFMWWCIKYLLTLMCMQTSTKR